MSVFIMHICVPLWFSIKLKTNKQTNKQKNNLMQDFYIFKNKANIYLNYINCKFNVKFI